jgi:hypothetical protein
VEKQCGFAPFASMVHQAARILQVLSSRQQQILILAQTVANNASAQLLAADAEKYIIKISRWCCSRTC